MCYLHFKCEFHSKPDLTLHYVLQILILKFTYSEKAAKFCEISTVDFELILTIFFGSDGVWTRALLIWDPMKYPYQRGKHVTYIYLDSYSYIQINKRNQTNSLTNSIQDIWRSRQGETNCNVFVFLKEKYTVFPHIVSAFE